MSRVSNLATQEILCDRHLKRERLCDRHRLAKAGKLFYKLRTRSLYGILIGFKNREMRLVREILQRMYGGFIGINQERPSTRPRS